MRLKFYAVGLALVLSALSSVSYARPAPPPPPIKNLEISGVISQGGKPVKGATVNARFYNCINKPQASAITNANGAYKLVIASYPRTVTIMRAKTPAQIAAMKKITPNNYLINRPIFEVRPVPIFVSTANNANEACVQAFKGGLEMPPKTPVNLVLKEASIGKPPPLPATNNEQQKCLAQGGKWENISRGAKGCNVTYKDGGRLCTDGNQCSSKVCLARDRNPRASEGQCATTTFSVINGCNGEIKRGRWASRPCP